MKTEKSIICGKHIRAIRHYLGLTQEEFGNKLGEWGITDKKKESFGKAPEIVASWESGRNQVPNNVLRAIQENVLFEGERISWAYLSGESEYITQSVSGILFHLFSPTSSEAKSSEYEPVTVEELAAMPLNKFANILIDDLLPLYGYSRSDVFDGVRFNRYMYDNIRLLIEEYIKKEKSGF